MCIHTFREYSIILMNDPMLNELFDIIYMPIYYKHIYIYNYTYNYIFHVLLGLKTTTKHAHIYVCVHGTTHLCPI